MSKGPNAFRTISEAAEEVGVPQHVLCFWETKFTFIRPMKRAGGRRFYRPQDVAVLKGVRRLLHDEGLTIRGVQRLHRQHGLRRISGLDEDMEAPSAAVESPAVEASPVSASTGQRRARLEAVLAEIELARARLEAVLED